MVCELFVCFFFFFAADSGRSAHPLRGGAGGACDELGFSCGFFFLQYLTTSQPNLPKRKTGCRHVNTRRYILTSRATRSDPSHYGPQQSEKKPQARPPPSHGFQLFEQFANRRGLHPRAVQTLLKKNFLSRWPWAVFSSSNRYFFHKPA